MSRYPSTDGLKSTVRVGSINEFTSISELANFNGPPAINGAASASELSPANAFEGISGLTGLETLDRIGRSVTMENSFYVNYPTGISNMTDVDGLHGVNEFANTNEFTSIRGLANIGGV